MPCLRALACSHDIHEWRYENQSKIAPWADHSLPEKKLALACAGRQSALCVPTVFGPLVRAPAILLQPRMR